MASPTKVYFPWSGMRICGEFYTPADGSPDRKGAGVAVSHPMTGVKEQTSADYARVLAKAGFYALTFDAAYQGESTGLPRGLEDPPQRAQDIKCAVTYLTSLEDKVDPARIGVLGICASGGYASYATQSDIRVRALATVSAACVGRMTRHGGVSEEQSKKEDPEAIAGALKAAGQERTKRTPGPSPQMFPTDQAQMPEGADSFFKDAAAYYGTSRGQHERSDQRVPPESYDHMVSYDSFNFQHLISPRALLMIAGANAQTLHYSKEAMNIAKEPKELFIIEGSNHFDLYDNLTESGPKVVEFFGKHLQ